MSKQSDAKAKQNYRDKPEWPECRNCKFFASDEVRKYSEYSGNDYVEEKNLRCTIGGFKVMKLGTCDKHQPK